MKMRKNTILTWKVEGYDYYFLITHSIEEVKDKYRSNIIKDKKYNPKEPDFRKSILKMKKVGLLENSNEAYKEETNESGEIISIFKFNKSYLDD